MSITRSATKHPTKADDERPQGWILHSAVILPPLDLHSAFSYWVLFSQFSDLCFVVEDKDRAQIIGFVSRIIGSVDNRVCYLWQLGVQPAYRNRVYASQLVEHFCAAARHRGCEAIQFSIAPNNRLSFNTARRYADRRKLALREVGEVSFQDPITKASTYEVLYELRFA